MRGIIEVKGRDMEYLLNVIQSAMEQDQSVKVCVDGGVKVKRGQSMWTPPLGYPVDNNGERIG
jgi:hypothetical protein